MLALCLKIFFVKILEVSSATIKTVYIVKNKKLRSAIAGFSEAFIWFLIVSEAMNTGELSIWVAIAYGGGYAAGVFVGGLISDKFIKGNFTIQVITRNHEVVDYLKSKGFGVTVVPAEYNEIKKYMLFIEIDKKDYNEIKEKIKKVDEGAFIVANETYSVHNGYMRK